MNEGLTVAGGGLAGLALALGLRRRGVPVTVHEAAAYPRHRVCGEFISGVSGDTLSALGLVEDLADAHRHRSVSWHRKGRELMSTELPEPAVAISRHRLDDRLRQRLESAGGVVHQKSRVACEPRDGLVWAAGRLPTRGSWIGLKCHLLDFSMSDGLEMHLGDNGYLGLTPVEDGRVNACGLFRLDRGIRADGSDLLLEYLRRGGNGELSERIAAAGRDERSFLGVAGFELGWQSGNPELCAVGDAIGMIPPFTGNGMSMALEGAEMALQPLEEWSAGQLAWPDAVTSIHSAARSRFRRRLRHALAMHRLLLHARGQSLLEGIARSGLLPFRPLLSLVR
ncbi:monooxygenase FAD-binding protein [Haloferula helveola]|uniref:Monooxygenase FAD-binding protein n=1 Tax=Haloferula helveola TaxID=490095 RepID=A0ABM7RHK7_9BACT|nr:monooxygenase FAD-binding protein [Haloferula helveola]